ncbi:hypothetical protein FRC11_014936, partial [Ceratobasidium sp. 423]
MVVEGMYETDEPTLDKRRCRAWNIACAKYEVDPNECRITARHVQNMTDRLCSWRGRARGFVRAYAERFFEKGLSKQAINTRVEELKAGALHMKPNSPRAKGHFQHEILQMCMNKMLFRDKKDYGPQFGYLFKKASVQLVCFFCAIVSILLFIIGRYDIFLQLQSLVEEYDTGTHGNENLDFEVQRKAYLTHAGTHEWWLVKNRRRWRLIQKQLPLHAFAHCGVSYSTLTVDIEKHMIPEGELCSDDPDEDELADWDVEMATDEPEGEATQDDSSGEEDQETEQDGRQNEEQDKGQDNKRDDRRDKGLNGEQDEGLNGKQGGDGEGADNGARDGAETECEDRVDRHDHTDNPPEHRTTIETIDANTVTLKMTVTVIIGMTVAIIGMTVVIIGMTAVTTGTIVATIGMTAMISGMTTGAIETTAGTTETTAEITETTVGIIGTTARTIVMSARAIERITGTLTASAVASKADTQMTSVTITLKLTIPHMRALNHTTVVTMSREWRNRVVGPDGRYM